MADSVHGGGRSAVVPFGKPVHPDEEDNVRARLGPRRSRAVSLLRGRSPGRLAGTTAGALVLGSVALGPVPVLTLDRAAAPVHSLIENGLFELPVVCPSGFAEYDAGSKAMPGWIVGGNSVDLVCENYFVAANGKQSVDLSGSAPGSVTQSVATRAGSRYTLSWDMAGNPVCGQAVKTMHVFWDGKLVDAPTFSIAGHNVRAMGWVKKQLVVTATGVRSTVEFADATPDHSECGAALDNVALVAG